MHSNVLHNALMHYVRKRKEREVEILNPLQSTIELVYSTRLHNAAGHKHAIIDFDDFCRGERIHY